MRKVNPGARKESQLEGEFGLLAHKLVQGKPRGAKGNLSKIKRKSKESMGEILRFLNRKGGGAREPFKYAPPRKSNPTNADHKAPARRERRARCAQGARKLRARSFILPPKLNRK